MANPIQQPATPGPSADTMPHHLREYTAAALAVVIVLGFIALMMVALRYTDTDERFERIMDLITVAVPVMGVVVGYYFGKTTGEARAESAEQTAKVASATAQQAVQGEQAAAQQARVATEAAEELAVAADRMLRSAAPPLGANADFVPSPAFVRLEAALRRAQRRLPSLQREPV